MSTKFSNILFVVLIAFSTFRLHASDVKFHNINAMYGISIRATATICSDDNGFIWTSSKTGILRLTDNDYRTYQLPYQTADIISVKLVYKKPDLLAYTNNGQVFRYNSIYDRFDFLFDLRKPLNTIHLYVSNILIENQKTYWISSNMGLYKYQTGELNLACNDSTEVSQAAWYDDRQLLFARNNKLWLIDAGTMKCNCIYENPSSLSFQVQKFYYDLTTKKLWIGTLSHGIFRYDFNTRTLSIPNIKSFPKQPVLAIEANSDSTILIGIDGQGIWEVDKNTDRILNIYKENGNDPSSLPGNGVYDIFCDRNKRVWVSTYSDGASFFEQISSPVLQITHQINNSNSLSNNHVNKIIEDSKGRIWFATNNGISCWDLKANQWKTFYHNKQEQAQVFLSLCEDAEGRIWAGTYSSGVYVLDGTTGKESAHYSREENDSPIDNYAFDIFRDSRGDLWIGGVWGDIIRYHVKENKFQVYSSYPLYSFAELSYNKILLACTYGLVLLDGEKSTSERLLQGYLTNDLLVMDGNVWIGTGGNGLIYLDMQKQTTEIFTMESGLPSNYVNSIAYAEGYLWLGTENGLCRFDPKTKTGQTYFTIFPLSRVSYNLNAHYRLKTGQLIWGTNNGAVLFNPSELYQLQPQGKIFFQDLFISGRSIRDGAAVQLNTPLDSLQNLKLKYNQNSISLELIPINAMADVKFSWKMDGLDKVWTPISNQSKLAYTNIPTGTYTLKMKMYDSSLSQVIAERQLLIRVTPPFWETVWFRLLVLAFAVGILYFSLHFYINRLKQRHAEDKVRFFAHTAHDIRTALTLIKAPIEELNKESNLSDSGKHYLSLATEQAGHLSSVATQLLDFQKTDIGKGQLALKMIDIVELIANRLPMFESFAMSKNIGLIYSYTPDVYKTGIDESMIDKVIDNLISNAIKYSHPDSQVQIQFTGTLQKWTMEVKDRGIGISPKAQKKLFREFYRSDNAVHSNAVGSGIGLLLAKNYISLHNGSITCVSQENVGSTFTISVPFREIPEKDVPVQPEKKKPSLPPEEFNLPENMKRKEMRILIVEDNENLRNFMLSALRETFEVSVAEDGVQAWNVIQQQMPDLVISDVMMPNRDGFELCSLIKSTYETSHIPVVLLTSLTEKAQQLKGLGLGADDYLTKPFDMTLLIRRVMTIIQNRKTVREKALKLIDEDNAAPILSNELNDIFVKKAVEVIHTNLANSDFGKEDFAAAMNVSSSLLYKKIKSLTDQSPVDFIKSIRLNRALELLQTHKYTITEVSELCGFSSVGYFSTAFKKHFGKQPSDIL